MDDIQRHEQLITQLNQHVAMLDDATINILQDARNRDDFMQGFYQELGSLKEEVRSHDKYNLEWHPGGPAELLALEGASKVIVQTTDEFLKSFSVEDFKNQDILNWMQSMEIPANQIGVPSGFGRLFSVPGQDYVLKIVNVCPDPAPAAATMGGMMCTMAHDGNIVFRIPNTVEKKMTVWAPNYLIEAIIGLLLDKMSKYSPGFMRVYGFQYDPVPPEKPLYVLTEKLEMARDHIVDANSYLYAMFQVAQALNTAQVLGKFTHYDLHGNNFMVRPLPRRRTRIYELGDGRYLYTRFNFDTVLIDYGFNRIETKDTMLVGRVRYERLKHKYPDILDYGAFNPYIDLFELIHHTAIKSLNDRLFPNWANAQDNEQTATQLLQLVMDMVSATEQDVNNVIQNHLLILGIRWRVAPERLAMQYTVPGSNAVYNHCRTPQQFMVALADFIGINMPALPNPIDAGSINAYLNANNFMIMDRLVKPGPNSQVYTIPSARSRMDTKYLNYQVSQGFQGNTFFVDELDPAEVVALGGIRLTYTGFNATRAQVGGVDINPATQYVHVAEINVARGHDKGYKFNFECCRLDLRTYMQNSNKNGCVAVNAAFFRLKDDFTPVGYYKTHDYTSMTPIPDGYRQYYALLAINNSGNLIIDPDITQHGRYNSFMSLGPILVSGGVQQMTDELIQNTPDFQSAAGQQIHPGQLNHVANPNPRTALCIRADGSVLIVYVEGRGDRGAGMDCAQLAQLCLRLGARDAINLDGGRSSQLVWREPGAEIISVAKYTNAYPVGNILSFCK